MPAVRHAVPNDSASSASAPSLAGDVLVLDQRQQGVITLPTLAFEAILAQLPDCVQRNEDDASTGPQYLPLPLVEVTGDNTNIRTRDVFGVADLLREAGFEVQIRAVFVHGGCQRPSENLSLSLRKDLHRNLKGLANQFRQELTHYRYARLVLHNDRQKWDYAALLCAMFPAPIVFVVASHDELEHVVAELTSRLTEPVDRLVGLKPIPQYRIMVATWQAYSSLELMQAPFVILPTWRAGFPRWMKRLLLLPFADRIYFLFTSSDVVTPSEQDGLLARVGPVLIAPDRVDGVRHVFSIIPFGGMPAVRHHERQPDERRRDPLNKRKLYWRHRRRNQAIAAVAEAISSASTSTAVLVENLEHAQKLVAMLPGWSLVRRDSRPDELPIRSIVTLTAADSWTKFRPNRLVIACGDGPSPWLESWLTEMRDVGHQVQVIDLADGFDARAAALAEARKAAYRRTGCRGRPLPKSVERRVRCHLRTAQRAEPRRNRNDNNSTR